MKDHNGDDKFNDTLIGVSLGLILDSLDRDRLDSETVEEEPKPKEETPEERAQRRILYKAKMIKGFCKGFLFSLVPMILIGFGLHYFTQNLFFFALEPVLGSIIITLITTVLLTYFDGEIFQYIHGQLTFIFILNALFLYPMIRLCITIIFFEG